MVELLYTLMSLRRIDMDKTNIAIREIKLNTQSLKDQRRNLVYKLNICVGKVEPDCFYGCTYKSYLNSLNDFDRKYIEPFNIQAQIYDIDSKLKCIGKTILFLRGDKWRI